MEAHRKHRDQQHRHRRQEERHHRHLRVIGEDVQPSVHEIPGYWESDETGDTYQQHEISRNQGDNSADTRAQNLADADLLPPLLGGKRDEAKQTQTRDDDRQN